MTKRTAKNRHAYWKQLNESADLTCDLLKVYDRAFFEEFPNYFDDTPDSMALLDGTLKTARAYIFGWHKKRSNLSEFGVHTGRHILQAGIAAKKLEYHLRQLSKSDLAAFILNRGLENGLSGNSKKTDLILADLQNKCGPARPMEPYRQIAKSLAWAANDLIELPSKTESESEYRARADLYSERIMSDKWRYAPKLSAHFALERAARTFQPVWEAHAKGLYYKGRYDETKGGYYSRPASALQFLIRQIDPEVKVTQAGTAIEKTRQQP